MNYYEFFELPVQLDIDLDKLKRKFYQNSKAFHPDFFTLSSSEAQAEALEKSSLNNEGYKVLMNFDQRLKYFLEIHDQLDEEGQNKIPQDFLMDMMEVNEQLMELEFDFDPDVYQQIQTAFQAKSTALKEAVQKIFSIEAGQLTEDQWAALKSFYLKNQYLKRLKNNLQSIKPA